MVLRFRTLRRWCASIVVAGAAIAPGAAARAASPEAAAAGTEAVAASAPVTRPKIDRKGIRPFELSLFPPVNVFHNDNKTVVGPSINLGYGNNPRVIGLEVGTFVNRTQKLMAGLQVASGVNWNEGRSVGITVAGLANFGEKSKCLGLCLAGIANGHQELAGVQLGGLANALKRGRGLQLTMGVNHVQHNFDGLQIGLMNWNNFLYVEKSRTRVGDTIYVEAEVSTWEGTSRALQISVANVADKLIGGQIGALNNVARGGVKGLQLSTMFNVGGKHFEGLQLSAINGANEVHGAQIGLINITRKLKGVQIGAINIATKNRVPVMLGMLLGRGKTRRGR